MEPFVEETPEMIFYRISHDPMLLMVLKAIITNKDIILETVKRSYYVIARMPVKLMCTKIFYFIWVQQHLIVSITQNVILLKFLSFVLIPLLFSLLPLPIFLRLWIDLRCRKTAINLFGSNILLGSLLLLLRVRPALQFGRVIETIFIYIYVGVRYFYLIDYFQIGRRVNSHGYWYYWRAIQ